MKLVDAVISGKPFKRPNDKMWWAVNTSGWVVSEDGYRLPSTVENLIAEDWKVKEETVIITQEELEDAMIAESGKLRGPSEVWEYLMENVK